jgi:3-oxoadipate enol-lactonase
MEEGVLAVRQVVHDVDHRLIGAPRAKLHAESHGSPHAPSVVLMGSLASDTTSWAPQIPALVEAGFRAVAFDFRGHGRSSAAPPPFTLALLQEDLRSVVRSFRLHRPHLVGVSLGGMIALGEALSAHADYGRIVVASTRADMPEPLAAAWAERAREVRRTGVGSTVEPTLERWFTAEFHRTQPDTVQEVRRMILRTDANAYADCIDIVRTIDLMDRLPAIRQPVLYLTGAQDTASPPTLMREMQQRTPGASFAEIPDAAHLPNIEQPETFNRLMIEFLKS